MELININRFIFYNVVILLIIITFLKENLQLWFVNIGKEIQTISMSDITAIQKISQIIKALNEVKGIKLIYYSLITNIYYLHYKINYNNMIKPYVIIRIVPT